MQRLAAFRLPLFPHVCGEFAPLAADQIRGANQTGVPMKKLALAIAIALAATSAQAVLVCKNDIGQTLQWNQGKPRPDTSAAKFDIGVEREIECFASNSAATKAAVIGLPVPPGLPLVADYGVIYRGIYARYLLDNITAADGVPATRADYDKIVP